MCMKHMNQKEVRRLAVHVGIFVAVMLLTFWSVFRGQDFTEIVAAVQQMSGAYMAAAILLAIFFVSAEGCMIWYLLRGIGEQTTLPRCIS